MERSGLKKTGVSWCFWGFGNKTEKDREKKSEDLGFLPLIELLAPAGHTGLF